MAVTPSSCKKGIISPGLSLSSACAYGGTEPVMEPADLSFPFIGAHGIQRHDHVGVGVGGSRVKAGVDGFELTGWMVLN